MAAGKSWQKLNWQDPFLLEQQLTDEQRMVRDSARQYAQDKLLPREGFSLSLGSRFP